VQILDTPNLESKGILERARRLPRVVHTRIRRLVQAPRLLERIDYVPPASRRGYRNPTMLTAPEPAPDEPGRHNTARLTQRSMAAMLTVFYARPPWHAPW
jgi:hypothetical protein